MSRLWKYFYLGYLWSLPMTIIGMVLATVFYKGRHWMWRDGVLSCVAYGQIWGDPDAQTLGWLEIYRNEDCRNLPDLRVHENTHIVQAFIGGLAGVVAFPLLFLIVGWSPLLGLLLGGFIGAVGFNLIYGILFTYLYLKDPRAGWVAAYFDIPFEVQAYRNQDRYINNPTNNYWGAS